MKRPKNHRGTEGTEWHRDLLKKTTLCASLCLRVSVVKSDFLWWRSIRKAASKCHLKVAVIPVRFLKVVQEGPVGFYVPVAASELEGYSWFHAERSPDSNPSAKIPRGWSVHSS